MHQTEANQIVACAGCGVEVVPGADRTYAISEELEVCYRCAVALGGAYDERLDRWSPPPDITELSAEAQRDTR